MTNRDFYTAIASSTTLPADVVEFAAAAIKKMDEKNRDRAAKPSKAALENARLADELFPRMVVGTVYTAGDIANLMDFKTEAGLPSTSKATAVAKILVEKELVKASETKIPKKGKCKVYEIVNPS